MSTGFGVLMAIVALWFAIGVLLSIVMGRRGHDSFGWLVLGTLLGPLALVLAADTGRHEERPDAQRLDPDAPVRGGSGPVDVLVGCDGSPESVAALDAVVDLLGDHLGRVTLATVVPFGDNPETGRLAADRLRRLGRRLPGLAAELEVLHGRPSAALRHFAAEHGDGLVVVGTRGAGVAKAVLGSAARDLARHCTVPVLFVGERRERDGERTRAA